MLFKPSFEILATPCWQTSSWSSWTAEMEMYPEVSRVTQVMEGKSLNMGKALTEVYFYRKENVKTTRVVLEKQKLGRSLLVWSNSMYVTLIKSTWLFVDKSCCISASLVLSSLSSWSSRWRSSSARLSSAFSWALISLFTSELLLFMESISSVNILSQTSSAACAKHWQDRDKVVKPPYPPYAPVCILAMCIKKMCVTFKEADYYSRL